MTQHSMLAPQGRSIESGSHFLRRQSPTSLHAVRLCLAIVADDVDPTPMTLYSRRSMDTLVPSLIFASLWAKMAEFSDDEISYLLQIQTIAVGMNMKRKTKLKPKMCLYPVNIHTARRKLGLPPGGQPYNLNIAMLNKPNTCGMISHYNFI